MTNQKMIVTSIVIAVAAGGLGYASGVKVSSLKRTSMFGNRNGQVMNLRNNAGNNTQYGKAAGNTPNMMGHGGAITGEVTAKDDKSLTVKMSDGSSKMIILSDKTTYRIADESSLDKITVGTKVATFGLANSDGSTTATNIEINPIMMEQAK